VWLELTPDEIRDNPITPEQLEFYEDRMLMRERLKAQRQAAKAQMISAIGGAILSAGK
jgi:hypothetical protein